MMRLNGEGERKKSGLLASKMVREGIPACGVGEPATPAHFLWLEATSTWGCRKMAFHKVLGLLMYGQSWWTFAPFSVV